MIFSIFEKSIFLISNFFSHSLRSIENNRFSMPIFPRTHSMTIFSSGSAAQHFDDVPGACAWPGCAGSVAPRCLAPPPSGCVAAASMAADLVPAAWPWPPLPGPPSLSHRAARAWFFSSFLLWLSFVEIYYDLKKWTSKIFLEDFWKFFPYGLKISLIFPDFGQLWARISPGSENIFWWIFF